MISCVSLTHRFLRHPRIGKTDFFYTRIVAIIFLSILSFKNVYGATSDVAESKIDCEVSINNTDNNYIIKINIKNKSREAIELLRDYLPWRTSLTRTLVLIPLGPDSEPLSEAPRIIDPTLNRVTLNPGKSLTGEIALGQCFQGVARLANRGATCLFWSFKIENAQMMQLGRYTGYFYISPRLSDQNPFKK